MTRAEHLRWAKDRALDYVERGELLPALSSLASDLAKHDALRLHPAINLGLQMLAGGFLGTPEKMRDFIEGFN